MRLHKGFGIVIMSLFATCVSAPPAKVMDAAACGEVTTIKSRALH